MQASYLNNTSIQLTMLTNETVTTTGLGAMTLTGPLTLVCSPTDPVGIALIALQTAGQLTILPAPPVAPTCYLWQLQAMCNNPSGLTFTPPTWAQVQTALATLGNASYTAYFTTTSDSISSLLTSVLAVFAATSPALSTIQVESLFTHAKALTIT